MSYTKINLTQLKLNQAGTFSGSFSGSFVGNGSGLTGVGGSSPSVINTAQLTSDQNDYAPTGWSTATLVKLSGDSGFRAIKGFSAGTNGEIKTLVNTGSYCIYLAPEHTASSAANRITHQEEVIIWPKSSCQIYYDSGASRWGVVSSPSTGYLVPTRAKIFDEPLARASTAASADNALDLQGSISAGVGSAASGIPFNYIDLASGATTSGGAGIMYPHDVDGAYYGDVHVVAKGFIRTPSAVSDGTNTYYYYLRIAADPYSGFFNQNNSLGIRAGNGVTNPTNWEAYSRSNGGTDTVVDTGVAFSVDTNYELMISLNKSNTEATYWINGNVVARITTNLPSAMSCGWNTQLEKQAGTSNRSVKIYRFMGAAIAP